jgi:E3 ubiquitin-protein ligase HUWE1
MISGIPTIDIDDLKKNTELVKYNKTDQIIIWLFEVLESFDANLKAAFLQFCTGTSRLPPEGFKALQGFHGPQKFNIHKYYNVNHLPRSHTCFNQLDLPPYETKELLIEKLTLAITEGKEGFGMV